MSLGDIIPMEIKFEEEGIVSKGSPQIKLLEHMILLRKKFPSESKLEFFCPIGEMQVVSDWLHEKNLQDAVILKDLDDYEE